MTLTIEADLEHARYLLATTRFVWVAVLGYLLGTLSLLLRRAEPGTHVHDSLRWLRLGVLAGAGFHSIPLLAFFSTQSAKQMVLQMQGHFLGMAALLLLIVLVCFRAAWPWLRNGGTGYAWAAGYWLASFLAAVVAGWFYALKVAA